MTTEISTRLLDILCCPITRRPLRRMDSQMLLQVNSAIAAGGVRNNGGEQLAEELPAALISTDGDIIYPLRDGVPVLLAAACIHWAAYKHG